MTIEQSRRGRWTAAQIPAQHGRTAVVTGANAGLGYVTALELARHGAAVVLACRDPGRAAAAAARITAEAGGGRVSTLELDLSSLASVRAAAARLHDEHETVDLLINNAGVLQTRLRRTADGLERTFATNHAGPFAFTGLVLDLLLTRPGSRVVTVSSIGHRRGRIDFDDLDGERGYRGAPAYFQSKLANLLFGYELQRRLSAAGAPTVSVLAHPGNARTEFGRDLPLPIRIMMSRWLRPLTWWLLQDVRIGALGTLRAATDPAARGGEYYGPPGRAQFVGHPQRVESSEQSHDLDAARRLWAISEELTGVRYPPVRSATV
jgi:NAD(P)-dependent dehydrogenase (short-subunit alcohol dehydrogenase family)